VPAENFTGCGERKFMREDKIEQKYISILKKMDGNKRVEVSYG